MVNTVDLHIQVNPETKTDAEQLHQPRFNAETEAAIQEARDIMSGKIASKSYASLQDFYDDLENDEEDA
jgi:DNA-damage-inducible protein J